MKFTLTDEQNLYILDAKCIIEPLLVIPDIIDKNLLTSKIIAHAAYHMWGKYISKIFLPKSTN